MEALTVDARFTVIESALKGYVKWRQSMDFSIPENVGIKLPATYPEKYQLTTFDSYNGRHL